MQTEIIFEKYGKDVIVHVTFENDESASAIVEGIARGVCEALKEGED